MIERYLILSARIKQELISLEKVVDRAKRANSAIETNPKNSNVNKIEFVFYNANVKN